MKIACGILASVVLLHAVPARAHDPGCLVVYENVTPQGVAVLLDHEWELADDVHTGIAGSIVLCAVDVRGRSLGAGTLSVRVFANDGDGVAPGALLAGPVDLVFDTDSGATATYHFEFPPLTVGQHLWISSRWEGVGGWAASSTTTATVGTSHDTWYYRTPGGDLHSDFGVRQADLHLVVYGTSPVPAGTATWGAIKAIYR